MASRTQIVCLCEGQKGSSIDEIFINRLMKTLKPSWLRREGSNVVRIESCGGRLEVIKRTPDELRKCLNAGGHTTLMVWADCDDDNGEVLRDKFWKEAEQSQINRGDFGRIVFIFAKYRLENWIQFLNTGQTNETEEGPRVKSGKVAADAAKRLADACKAGQTLQDMPPSLEWSCKNWRTLAERMSR